MGNFVYLYTFILYKQINNYTMTKTIDIKKTYKKGDTVSIGGTVYELSDEKVDKGCDGCAFINRYDCEKLRAHICRAGLIFKKVKK